MALEIQMQRKELQPGTTLSPINNPYDAPTILADHIAAVTVNAGVAKIGFTQQLGNEHGEAVIKFVVNLAIPTGLIPRVIETLNAISNQPPAENP